MKWFFNEICEILENSNFGKIWIFEKFLEQDQKFQKWDFWKSVYRFRKFKNAKEKLKVRIYQIYPLLKLGIPGPEPVGPVPDRTRTWLGPEKITVRPGQGRIKLKNPGPTWTRTKSKTIMNYTRTDQFLKISDRTEKGPKIRKISDQFRPELTVCGPLTQTWPKF